MSLRIRRGLSSDRTSIIPDEGEFLYNTDDKLLYIGDGTTPGGNPVDNTGSGTVVSFSFTDSTGITGTVTNPTTTPNLSLSLTKYAVGLGNVENTALSTWAGSTNITTLGVITTGTWNANTISIAHGGTGQNNANSAFNALAPVQTSSAGKYLKTDGSNTYWASGSAITSGIDDVLAVGQQLTADRLININSHTLSLLNGNVGIGTATPSAKLEIAGGLISVHNLSEEDIQIGNYTGVNSVVGLYASNADQKIAELDILNNVYKYANGDIKSDATNVTINKSILPSVSNTYDLGSSSLLWKDLYIRGIQKFGNGTNSNLVSLQSGVTSASYTLTLPTAVAASTGYVLTSTNAGVTSWADPNNSGWTLVSPTTSTSHFASVAAGNPSFAGNPVNGFTVTVASNYAGASVVSGAIKGVNYQNGASTNATARLAGVWGTNVTSDNGGGNLIGVFGNPLQSSAATAYGVEGKVESYGNYTLFSATKIYNLHSASMGATDVYGTEVGGLLIDNIPNTNQVSGSTIGIKQLGSNMQNILQGSSFQLPNIPTGTAGTDSVVVKTAGGELKTISPTYYGVSGWGLTGNSGTTAGTNFVGTTDATDVSFKRNSTELLRLNSSQVYIPDPASLKVDLTAGFGYTTPVSNITLSIGGFSAGAINSAHVISANGTYSNKFTVSNTNGAATGSANAVYALVSNNTDGASQTADTYRPFYAEIQSKSTSATPVTNAIGYDFLISNGVSAGTQSFTNVYGYHTTPITTYYTGGLLSSGGNYYELYLSGTTPTSIAAGTGYGIYQKTSTMNNRFEAVTNSFPNLPTYSSGGNTPVVLNTASGRLEISPITSGGYTVVTVTSTTYNAPQTSGEIIILVDAATAGGNVTVNLSTAIGNTAKFIIKKIDSGANTVTLDGNSTETIDGSLTVTILYQYSRTSIISNNANWFIID